jgi:hypothetical protein
MHNDLLFRGYRRTGNVAFRLIRGQSTASKRTCGTMPNRRPALLAFDLDGTLWCVLFARSCVALVRAWSFQFVVQMQLVPSGHR